jgi:hypothetical protein
MIQNNSIIPGFFVLAGFFTLGILYLLWAGKIDVEILGNFLKIKPKT